MLRSLRAVPDAPPAATRRARLRAERRLRSRRRTTAALATIALVTSALPSAAAAGSSDRTEGGLAGGAHAAVAEHGGVVAPEDGGVLPPSDRGAVRALATIEDADAWCDYLSSYYLAFPSPWSARVINCRWSDLFVAPRYSDGTLGMCVLVPARHSRHLGGSVARWVTDIRLC